MVQVEKGKVYEIAGLWVKPGKAEQLKQYFQKAMPFALKYGAKPLIGFKPLANPSGDFMPMMLGLNEWPSQEAFQQFLADPEWQKLVPLRDDALEKMVVSHFAANDSRTIEFHEGRVYEIAGMWVKPGKTEQLGGYFHQAMPFALKHGARPLAGFRPLYAYRGDFLPDMLGLNEWPSEDAFGQFLDDPEWRKLAPARDDALSKLTVTHCFANVAPPPPSK